MAQVLRAELILTRTGVEPKACEGLAVVRDLLLAALMHVPDERDDGHPTLRSSHAALERLAELRDA